MQEKLRIKYQRTSTAQQKGERFKMDKADYDETGTGDTVTRALELDNSGIGGSVRITAAQQALQNTYICVSGCWQTRELFQ